jgi:hypothetical protein
VSPSCCDFGASAPASSLQARPETNQPGFTPLLWVGGIKDLGAGNWRWIDGSAWGRDADTGL